LLLAVPAAIALQCFVSNVFEDHHVIEKTDCTMKDEQYCKKMTSTDVHNKTTVFKSCGNGDCTSEYCDDKTGICCCKGSYCNSTGSQSILMTSLAAAAIWLRL
ncbi:hypothetical protein PMAYCL1PPCAC_20288, partial [Pristionchus mayeri]